jgi:hypothetical protein
VRKDGKDGGCGKKPTSGEAGSHCGGLLKQPDAPILLHSRAAQKSNNRGDTPAGAAGATLVAAQYQHLDNYPFFRRNEPRGHS